MFSFGGSLSHDIAAFQRSSVMAGSAGQRPLQRGTLKLPACSPENPQIQSHSVACGPHFVGCDTPADRSGSGSPSPPIGSKGTGYSTTAHPSQGPASTPVCASPQTRDGDRSDRRRSRSCPPAPLGVHKTCSHPITGSHQTPNSHKRDRHPHARALTAASDDAPFLQFSPQCLGGHPEDASRSRLVASGSFQHSEDMFLLDFRQWNFVAKGR